MLYCAFGLYPKLAIVAIGTMHNPDALDLLGGEGFNVLLLVAYQAQAANATPIGEGDVFAIRFNLPARMLVFHAPIVMLELRIALLAGLLVLAVLIEAFNGQPGSISRSLNEPGWPLNASMSTARTRSPARRAIRSSSMTIGAWNTSILAGRLNLMANTSPSPMGVALAACAW